MHDTALQDHLTIVGLLPDFVLAKLDETTLRRVAQHLELCPICRDECANADDMATSDLFTEITRDADKMLWFVEAHLHAKR